jgi:hypothetical protein
MAITSTGRVVRKETRSTSTAERELLREIYQKRERARRIHEQVWRDFQNFQHDDSAPVRVKIRVGVERGTYYEPERD